MSSHNPLTSRSQREFSTHPPSKDVAGSQKDLTRSAFSKEFKLENLSRTVEAQGKENASRLELPHYSPQTRDASSTPKEKPFNPDFSKHLQQMRDAVANAEKALKDASQDNFRHRRATFQIVRGNLESLEKHAATYYPDLISPEPPQAGVFSHDTTWTTMRHPEITAY